MGDITSNCVTFIGSNTLHLHVRYNIEKPYTELHHLRVNLNRKGQLEESTIKHDYPSASYSANLLQGDNRFDNGIFGGGPEGGDPLCVVTDLLHPDEDAVMRTIFQRLSHLK